MSAKRMIDYVKANGLVNPASNYRYFIDPSTRFYFSPKGDERFRKMIQPISKFNRQFVKMLEMEDVPVIDYSNLFQSGIDEASKLDSWWKDYIKRDNLSTSRLLDDDEEAKQERQLRAVNHKLGAVRPPFDNVWMEAKIPKSSEKNPLAIALSGGSCLAERIGWCIGTVGSKVSAGLYFSIGQKVFGPVICCFWHIDEAGCIVSKVELHPTETYGWMHEELNTKFQHWCIDVCLPTLTYALAFLNCKNVKQAQIEPNPKLSKRWRKKTGKPLSRYHVLTVGRTYDAKRERVETHTEGSEEHRKAQHITRGHFRTYTPEKPLFGRWHGTLWIPSHVRGSKEEGVVTKSYKLAQ
tara:strand:- start:4920 stop:5975 length:1056 start_codon:yes stop_codon:yes gene_type:complete